MDNLSLFLGRCILALIIVVLLFKFAPGLGNLAYAGFLIPFLFGK